MDIVDRKKGSLISAGESGYSKKIKSDFAREGQVVDGSQRDEE